MVNIKMLNIIWPIFIIISIMYGICTGKIDSLNESVFNSSKDAIDLVITLTGTMCLWNGLIEIAANTNLIKRLSKLLNPLIIFLFPSIENDEKIKKEVSMNMIANMLGIGNAATPLGLKAIKSMQEKNINKEKLTDDMATFVVLNTLSIQIIPTTVIAIRMSLGSVNPNKIIFAVWFSTICSAVVGITITKLFIMMGEKR